MSLLGYLERSRFNLIAAHCWPPKVQIQRYHSCKVRNLEGVSHLLMEPEDDWQGLADREYEDPDDSLESLAESDPWSVSTKVIRRAEEFRYVTTDPSTQENDEDQIIDFEEEWGSLQDDKADLVSDEEFWQSDWDEPEPEIDAESGLNESLYPPDESINDLSIEVKISEALSLIEGIDQSAIEGLFRRLKSMGVARLRRFLPWLRKEHWNGARLILFLEFREYWARRENCHWWELYQWSDSEQCWMPQYQPSSLTWEHCRILVDNRFHYLPHRVIDKRWFEEWEDCRPWELGIRSFASFAIFRSSIASEGSWLDQLQRYDTRNGLEMAQCRDFSYAPFMMPSFQDQYEIKITHTLESELCEGVRFSIQQAAAALGGDVSSACQIVLGEIQDARKY